MQTAGADRVEQEVRECIGSVEGGLRGLSGEYCRKKGGNFFSRGRNDGRVGGFGEHSRKSWWGDQMGHSLNFYGLQEGDVEA